MKPASHAGEARTCRAARCLQGCEIGLAHVLLCANVSKEELGKGGLRVKPWREQQGAGAIMLPAELRAGTAHLEEDGHDLEGILCQELLRTERPRREAANEGITVPTYGHERVHAGLDTVCENQQEI